MSNVRSGRTTQSFRLHSLFKKKNNSISRNQITTALKLDPEAVGSYLAEFKRVYGAKVNFDRIKHRYILKNKINVPRNGIAGRRSVIQQHKAHML